MGIYMSLSYSLSRKMHLYRGHCSVPVVVGVKGGSVAIRVYPFSRASCRLPSLTTGLVYDFH